MNIPIEKSRLIDKYFRKFFSSVQVSPLESCTRTPSFNVWLNVEPLGHAVSCVERGRFVCGKPQATHPPAYAIN